jgi:hypothetical protein
VGRIRNRSFVSDAFDRTSAVGPKWAFLIGVFAIAHTRAERRRERFDRAEECEIDIRVGRIRARVLANRIGG